MGHMQTALSQRPAWAFEADLDGGQSARRLHEFLPHIYRQHLFINI
jgi:hypothetical protein